MRRTSLGALGVLLLVVGALAARKSSARQPCRIQVENLQLTLQEVRIDGALATEVSSGNYAVDGGATVRVEPSPVVSLGDDRFSLPMCKMLGSRTFVMSVSTDPLTGQSAFLSFEVVP